MSHGPTDSVLADRPPPLRREVILRTNDRGRTALLSALLALAGVELGLVLALTGLARRSTFDDRPAYAYVDRSAVPMAMPAATEMSWLGVEVESVPTLLVKSGGAGPDGALVAEVFAGTPAERAGIAAGDIIRRIDGEAISSPSSLVRAIRSHWPGELVTIELYRKSEARAITTHLAAISPSQLHILERRSR